MTLSPSRNCGNASGDQPVYTSASQFHQEEHDVQSCLLINLHLPGGKARSKNRMRNDSGRPSAANLRAASPRNVAWPAPESATAVARRRPRHLLPKAEI